MTRQEAIAAGEKRYDGKPCKNCERTEKFVSGYNCVACSYESTRRWHRENYKHNPTWRKCRNSEERRQYGIDWKRRDRYGIEPEEYRRLLDAQDNACLICERSFDGVKAHIDHCHEDGHVRGLLCGDCNRGLGMFRDNPDLLESAARYLHDSQGALYG